MVLKNELENLANYLTVEKQRQSRDSKEVKPVFSEVVSEGCCRARKSWAAAAFSDSTNEALNRYFDFHFTFLNNLIAENSSSGYPDERDALYKLMDHLLAYYAKYIDQDQLLAREYTAYRIGLLKPAYLQFIQQSLLLNTDKDLKLCLKDSLDPIYLDSDSGLMTLAALFYREYLLTAIAGEDRNLESMTDEILISALMALNFNHARFFNYLRKRSLKLILNLRPENYAEYFAELITAVPVNQEGNSRCFDSKWPHISEMYREWLNDYRTLLNASSPGSGYGASFLKVPLNISVKQLACVIRALYQSGFYGTVSLTAIFDHAATVFSSKCRERISAESISNAYYALDSSASLKVVRMLGSAIDFLKPYCFPA